MGALWTLSLPGLICLLVVLVAVDLFGRWVRGRRGLPWRRRDGPGTPVSPTAFEEVDAFFSGAKRAELEHRRSAEVLRDDQDDGAPPRPVVDLDGGVVTFVVPHGEGRTGR